MSGIYDEPELYELACAYRNVPTEVDALQRWCDLHWNASPSSQDSHTSPAGAVGSVLELAAGPAEHALEFARRGVDATALDLSPAMCARSRDKAARAGVDLTVVEADMRDFRIPRTFDLAITMLNSLCHLFTLDDLLAHLSALGAHLDAGALYIVELAHPADYLATVPRTSSDWTSEVGGDRVDVHWGGQADPIDPVSQITREHVSVTVRAAGGDIRTVTDVVPNRFWTATEVTAAVRLEGSFSVLASYGDFDGTTTVDDPRAWRMILILRRER